MSATANFRIPKEEEERFLTFEMKKVLPPNYRLTVDRLNHLAIEHVITDNEMEVIELQSFTDEEFVLLFELLVQFPDHTPLECLLQAKEGRSVEYQRDRLYEAMSTGMGVDSIMKATRNALSRTRAKMHPLGIDIASLTGIGYALLPYTARFRRT